MSDRASMIGAGSGGKYDIYPLKHDMTMAEVVSKHLAEVVGQAAFTWTWH